MSLRHHASHLFPYTTLFRSWKATKTLFLIHPEDLSILQSMQSRVRQFMGFEVPPPPRVDGYLKDGDSLKVEDETVHVLQDRKSTRLNSSHITISYAVFCLKK